MRDAPAGLSVAFLYGLTVLIAAQQQVVIQLGRVPAFAGCLGTIWLAQAPREEWGVLMSADRQEKSQRSILTELAADCPQADVLNVSVGSTPTGCQCRFRRAARSEADDCFIADSGRAR